MWNSINKWCKNNNHNEGRVSVAAGYVLFHIWVEKLNLALVLSQMKQGGGPEGDMQFPGHFVLEKRGRQTGVGWGGILLKFPGRPKPNAKQHTHISTHTHTRIAFLSINSKCFVHIFYMAVKLYHKPSSISVYEWTLESVLVYLYILLCALDLDFISCLQDLGQ